MTINSYRPTKDGTHTFDAYNYPSVFGESTRKKIQNIQKEDLEKFNKDIYSNLSDKGKIKIFFLSEYIKRQFYLDCIVEKDNNGNYKKYKIQKLEFYIDKKYTDIQNFIDGIPSLYTIDKRQKKLVFNINMNDNHNRNTFFDAYVSFNYENLYFFIKDTYFYYLNRLIDIINNPFKYFNNRINYRDKDFLENFSGREHTLYEYERVLYHISKYKNLPSPGAIQQELYKIVKLINNHFLFTFDHSLLDLYRNIVDYYLLYPSHLFEMTNMNDIILNNFQLNKISRFFFLPKEIKIDNPLEDIVYCVLQNLSGQLKISIELTQKNFDSIEISKHVSEQIILALYSYKEDTQRKYSEQEIENFRNYIDTYSKKNEVYNLKERAISLHIWDLIYIHKNHPSISEHITHIYKKIHQKTTANDIRKYQRAFSATSQSIEKRELFPLA